MKIKMIQSIKASVIGPIQKGEILTVRHYPDGSLLNFNRPYQVIEGQYSGAVIPLTHCIVFDEEKTYTEKQWNDMENHYMAELDKERAAKDRAIELVTNITKQLLQKNKEIERQNFLLQLALLLLEAESERLEEKRKA